MAVLVALAGFSGAGKTTAADYFCNAGLAKKIYFGDVVLNEVRARGLPLTADTERAVRIELRERHGPAVFACRATPLIKAQLNQGVNVVVDAVFQDEEYRCLQDCCSTAFSCILLAIEASFATRSQRLVARRERPYSSEELKARDNLERQKLHTDTAISGAKQKILN